MNLKALIAATVFAMTLAAAPAARAQSSSSSSSSSSGTGTGATSTSTTTVTEDFTQAKSENQWFFFNGACLTAGTDSNYTSPGNLPPCLNSSGTAVFNTYYNLANDRDTTLVGGAYGYLGSSSSPATADPAGSGALRFTNGYPYGHYERGAIVYAGPPFNTGNGVSISFKTITYLGKGGSDGADGISFYLMDGCVPINGGTSNVNGSTVPSDCGASEVYGTVGQQTFPAIGATGGSLAYTCTNTNGPVYDGLVGAYIGLGIDEYGNFLNGWVNTLNETGSTGTSGGSGSYNDNTASGGLYQPGRIGLRGAGSVSWQALTTAYGSNVGNTSPYYPASMGTTCSNTGYTFQAGLGYCTACASGTTYNGSNNTCFSYSCATGTTLSAAGNTCLSCSSGSLNTSTGQCTGICPSGYTSESDGYCYQCNSGTLTYNSSSRSWVCISSGRNGTSQSNPSKQSATTASPTSAAATLNTSLPATGPTQGQLAVQKTCENGLLYNYASVGAPSSVGAASLSNTANTAKILDYPAIGSTDATTGAATGYSVLSSANPISATGATTRATAVPIVYNLKITQDGFLSLSYNYRGGTTTPVITSQSITGTNGALPKYFRFGFAGSTGGSTNVHEILCFKAQPAQSALGTGGVTVFQDPTLHTGTQQFLAFYYPMDWTGDVTATRIFFDTGNNTLALATAPTWDASCILTNGLCSGVSTYESPSQRVMITWNGTQGIPFEYNSLTPAQQTALTAGDSTPSNARLSYLRGDTTNEINASGAGMFRKRDRILGDIVDSSPTWVGPPSEPYVSMTSWTDGLYPGTGILPENNGPTYASYAQSAAASGRTNVVYVGANDGFLHGFRAGTLDSSGDVLSTTSQPNDGWEVMAYMPAAVLNNIHPYTTNSSGNIVVTASADYSNTQYSHAYFVDATPAMGDLFYGATATTHAWHTWLVGGLGAGGSAIYALDVTSPTTQYTNETTAATHVIGEWNPGNLKCAAASAIPACGQYLGNTYGTPEIRRFHNGQWGVIFGNGYGSVDTNGYVGAAGIYIMLIDTDSGAPTFYYLQATPSGSTAAANGIGSPTSLDVDLDHIVDYIYAGDLLGNVWRFDVTSQDPTKWAPTSTTPLFTAPWTPAVAASGTIAAIPSAPSPITTRLQVGTLKTISTSQTNLSVTTSSSPERVMINFGTGQQIPQTPTTPAQYAQSSQYLYGIWDWNFSAWNAMKPAQQVVSLNAPQTIVPPPSSSTNLQVQTITDTTVNGVAVRSLSTNIVCWMGDTACGSNQTQFGWYIQLPAPQEQLIFDPTYSPDGEFVVSTYIPAANDALSCKDATPTGFSMGIDPLMGGESATPFFNVGGASYDGIELNGTGTPAFLSSGQAADNNAEYMLTQTTSGVAATPQKVNRHSIVTGQRLNWIQRR